LCEVAAATGAAAGCSVEQGPTVSPCPRCAGSAFCETVIVTNGFVFEWVWWQIVTFEAGYWSAVGVESENPTTLAAIPVPANDAGTPMTSARAAATARRARLELNFMGGPPLRVGF
jgi:hypothetical protein